MSVAAKREERLAVIAQRLAGRAQWKYMNWTIRNLQKLDLQKKFHFFLKKDLLFLKWCHIIVKAIRSKGFQRE